MKEKKALQLASVASMIDQFNISNIQILQSLGYRVDAVADFTNPGTITVDHAERLRKRLSSMGVRVIDIAIPRSLNPIAIVSAYKKVERLVSSEHYDLIHCHSPIGGVLCRQAARKERKRKTKVIYTAHGFHFYDGAPLVNWIAFYPIERHYSRYTDVLITINSEDYKRASEHFFANKTVKIPGVGVDTEKFAVCKVDIKAKRAELGVKDDDFLLLSVGEDSEGENQRIVIEALAKMKEEGTIGNVVYLAVDKGEMQKGLKQIVEENGLEKNAKLLGFRADIDELCETADCFVCPSVREGPGIAPLEAMAAGLPLITANVNDIKDYAKGGVSGCCVNPTSVDEMVTAIKKMHNDETFRALCASNNYKTARFFDIRNMKEIMTAICKGGYKHLSSIAARNIRRGEFGISNHDFVIISVGELNANKNHQVIINAIARIPNAKYLIVGKGPLEQELKSLAATLGVADRVMLTGYRTDVAELLYASDCFAFPSKREGLGLAALEGMASGLPLITSNSGGISDYSRDGITGFVAENNAAVEYSEAIKKLMGQSSYCMSKKCIEICNAFDKESSDMKMREVYADLLDCQTNVSASLSTHDVRWCLCGLADSVLLAQEGVKAGLQVGDNGSTNDPNRNS